MFAAIARLIPMGPAFASSAGSRLGQRSRHVLVDTTIRENSRRWTVGRSVQRLELSIGEVRIADTETWRPARIMRTGRHALGTEMSAFSVSAIPTSPIEGQKTGLY